MASDNSSNVCSNPPDDGQTSKENARKWQTVFRVRLNPQPAPAQTRNLAPEKRKSSGFRPRRSHRKSKAGCLVCKRRKVKCDEARPGCHNCANYGVACNYPAALTPPSASKDITTVTTSGPSRAMFSMSLDNLAAKIEETLRMHSDSDYYNTVESISTPAIRKVMRTEAIRVAFSNPHLMHTIIGVSLLHLNRILPPCKAREFAEAHHWQKAIQSYRTALCYKVSPANVDALLTTCMLMLVNCMCPQNFRPCDSWVLSSNPSAMNWICLQNGLPYLLELSGPILHLSIWGPAFKAADQAHEILLNNCERGREGMHPRLADFCEIHDSTTAETSPYFKPLQVASSMLELEKSATTSGYFSSFLGHLDQRYIALLRAKDARALIILAHWMGIMCLISHWEPWVEGRLRAECIAICIYFTPSADTELLELLKFPSIASGFTDAGDTATQG
ncbi:C6 zinc finger domain-containing protein [Arthroderma uncinatum]|uniref:C6 zinc finger domain-containing protein n=1 Tax=Arthroderma uncinatum TaxID=74035 RepID=UPI00144AF09B|nr:C6 zinc finger domain-containing protein [Arthroderma uncinatum]KAF3482582.1 C6 zinc finger domain-containing protein [Arthroderma uncinatum]